MTFLLTSGGHNAGIVSEPGHPGRSYQISTSSKDDKYRDPDNWLSSVATRDGSWWPSWENWLAEKSTTRVPPPSFKTIHSGYKPVSDAPGTYVLAE